MNTPAVAQNLASRGRGEDKMLVHMTPSEVQGLQALAMAKGGSLTINPETGLPEAGFLSDTFKALAPTIVGAGAMYLSGGTIQPWMIGLGAGAFETARTGDLGRGLMAGLGAYGGANLVGGLSGFGAAQAGQTGAEQTGQALSGGVDTTAMEALGGGMVDPVAAAPDALSTSLSRSGYTAGSSGASPFSLAGRASSSTVTPASINVVSSQPAFSAFDPSMVTSAGTTTNPLTGEVVGSPNLVANLDGTVTNYANPYGVGITDKPITAESIAQTAADRTRLGVPEYAPSFRQNIDTGISRLGEKGGFSEFAKTYPGGKLGMAALIAPPAIKSLEAAGAFDQPELALQEETDYNYEGPYLPAERTARFRGRDAILSGEGREFKFFDDVNPFPNVRTAANGGLMSAKMAGGGDIYTNTMEYIIPRDEYGKKIPSSELFEEKAEPFTIPRDEGGNRIPMDLERMIELLNARKPKKMAQGGRYLDGPGDGVSDSIPATVDGEQPVLLSEGEYIIPAEVVSAVGNGSSDAGADKFTALVDTIMAKTRRVAKGKPNGADKLLKGLIPQTA